MKEDLRVTKTIRAIEEAFISLIEEKGFENVKIVDIAKRANVNRNTIYLHYDSKEAIIEKIIDERFSKEIDAFNIKSYVSIRNNKKKFQAMFAVLFDILQKDIELYRIILTDQNLAGYLAQKMKKIKTYVLDSFNPTLKNEIIVQYSIYGVFGIIQNWIIYDRGTAEENIKLITDLVTQNVKHLQFI